jgi:thymidylate synthase ThyX
MMPPYLARLLLAVDASLPQVVEHLPHDIFAHAQRQVIGDDAHDRHLRHGVVAEDVVDARADRKDRLQIRQARQHARALLPHHGKTDGGIVRPVRLLHHFALRQLPELFEPPGRIPAGGCEQNPVCLVRH